MSNFCRSHGFPMINSEIELYLSRSKECIMTEISITPAVPDNPDCSPPVPDMTEIQQLE